MNLKTTNNSASTSRTPTGDSAPSHYSTPNDQPNLNNDVQADIYYGKLAFNHDISVYFHSLCSEACRNRLQMKYGIADLALLQEVLRLVDGHIDEMQSTAFMPQISLTPRQKKRKRTAREEIPQDSTKPNSGLSSPRSTDTKKANIGYGIERETALNTPKRNLSLYRTDRSPIRSTSATPFDLLLKHNDMAVPDSPRTPTKKPGLKEIPSKGNLGVLSTSNVLSSQESSISTVTIISDDEEDGIMPVKEPMKEISNLLQELNGYRRKLSITLGRLPEEILPLRTLKQLSTQPPPGTFSNSGVTTVFMLYSDYKAYQRILADTSGIPESEIEEREAYVLEKWTETGSKFFAICMQFRIREQASESVLTESTSISGTAATFRKMIATHGHTLDKAIDLSQYSFSAS
ncbi:hypothetical protein F5890DRAFT_1483030 [Lentinula detonsa]|uniref:Uncharacterized protein n=1 Tax=Lentinula detonsa TaxID=2804962 RepID=A0AA38UX17_9AGAR|nr:hypothetical protein F5890DRAFT_1483030 [Lentinula detonsa]